MTFWYVVAASALGQLAALIVVVLSWAVTSLVRSVLDLREIAIERRIANRRGQ